MIRQILTINFFILDSFYFLSDNLLYNNEDAKKPQKVASYKIYFFERAGFCAELVSEMPNSFRHLFIVYRCRNKFGMTAFLVM